MAGNQIQRRVMPGVLALDLARGDFVGCLRSLHQRVGVFGHAHPLADIRRLRCQQRHARLERLELAFILADHGTQHFPLDCQIVFCRQFLSDDQIVARLCFVDVGNGRRADIERTLGCGKLFADGGFLRARRGQRFLRQQNIEIGLCDTHDQDLSCSNELRFGTRDRQFRLIVGNPILHAEQRLRQRDRPAVAVVLFVGIDVERPRLP